MLLVFFKSVKYSFHNMAKQYNYVRYIVREGLARYPAEAQEVRCKDIVDELGIDCERYAVPVKGAREARDGWGLALRSDELGLVDELWLLKLTRKQAGGDPKADFSGFLSTIEGDILEVSSGIRSTQKKRWRKLVEDAIQRRAPGARTMSSEQASRISRKGHEKRRGITFLWWSVARETERYHLIRHWHAAPSARVAMEKLPEFIDKMGGGVYDELKGRHVSTVRRIVLGPDK